MTPSPILTNYTSAYAELTAALAELEPLGEAFLHYKPRPEAWSVHEIVVHLADSEANSYVRLRRLAAEPGSMVLGYAQDVWPVATRYREQSRATALETFRWLRQSSAELLALLPDAVAEHACVHSESGAYPFAQWLQIYADHVPGHIGQMRRNLAAWEAAGRPG
jgi:hypothetical protein